MQFKSKIEKDPRGFPTDVVVTDDAVAFLPQDSESGLLEVPAGVVVLPSKDRGDRGAGDMGRRRFP